MAKYFVRFFLKANYCTFLQTEQLKSEHYGS